MTASTQTPAEAPIISLMHRLRSAARTGRRLHLEAEHVQLLLSEEIYGVLSRREGKDILASCVGVANNDNSAETSGSGSDPTTAHGASAGSNVIPLDAASRGARSRLSAALSEVERQKKRSMR